MWELDHKEGWELKNGCFELWCWRRLLRVPWTARRSNPSILKEISPEQSLERLMLKLRLPILWPHDVKNWLIGKDLDAGKDWRREEEGMAEDEMVGWYHRLEGQGSLACCSPWDRKELDTTEWLNNSNSPGGGAACSENTGDQPPASPHLCKRMEDQV